MSPPPGGWPDLDSPQRNTERRGPAAARDVSLGEHLRLAVGSHRREPGASSHPARVNRESREPRADQRAHYRLADGLPIIGFVPGRYAGAEEPAGLRRPRPGCRSHSSEEIPVWPQPPLGDSRLGSRSSECGVLLPPIWIRGRSRGAGQDQGGASGRAGPALVLVGLGFAQQERLISSLRSEMPQTWFVGVGISFSFLAREQP